MNKKEFYEAVEMLKSKDSLTYEEGFYWLIGSVDFYQSELTDLMKNETDYQLRAKFVEVLGNGTNVSIIQTLKTELSHPHREVRSWAYSQLAYFESSVAEKIAADYKTENPNEDFY